MKIKDIVYLDHQATTPVDKQVLSEMVPFFDESFGNPHSSNHWLGWESSRTVEESANRIARLIGADNDEIIFTSGATESNNLALLGLGRRMRNGDRRRILLSAIEHKCVQAVGKVLSERYGFKVEVVAVDHEGFVDLSVLDEMMDDDVLAVAIMAVNNEIGTIQDVKKISTIVRRHGAHFHCDATQAPIAMGTQFIARYVDTLSLSAHKMYGPKGIGILYVSRGIGENIEPLIYGGGQQGSLRSGTIPVPLCVGMAAAAEMFIGDNAEEKRVALRNLSSAFHEKLRLLNWPIALNGPDVKHRHAGNVNVRFIGFSALDILNILQPHIAASTGSACTSGFTEPSHVLRAIGLTADEAESSIRFSLGFGTCDTDLNYAAMLIRDTLDKLAKSQLRVG